jgi:peptidyl-prolyl cis-trans isomerase SurA
MKLLAVRRRSLVFAAAILTAGLGATAVVDVKAVSAQAPKAKKAPAHSSAEQSTSEGDAPAPKGTQAIVVLVNDEPITAWEIDQRLGFIATSSGGNPAT